MDARITKQRLGNLLSYDWLKILGAIVAAAFSVYVIFVMIATRPTTAQIYSVYTYSGLKIGTDSSGLVRDLEGKFSYEILEADMENFESGTMGEQALSARRSMLEGDAVVVADYTEEEESATEFTLFCGRYSYYGGPGEALRGFYGLPALSTETERYLSVFFDDPSTEADETFTATEPDADAVREAFFRKNGSDKRFKTEAQREAGVAAERARLLAIRENYSAVSAAFENGDLYTVNYTFDYRAENAPDDTAVEVSFPIGVGLGRLAGLSDLFFYYQGESVSSEKLVLLFFDNGTDNEEAKYENWTFLRYLLDAYAPVHS